MKLVELKEQLCAFIAEELLPGGSSLGLDDNLLADGMIDSMSVVRLVAFIDERFGYLVPPEDILIDHFRTVNQLAVYLESRIDGAN